MIDDWCNNVRIIKIGSIVIEYDLVEVSLDSVIRPLMKGFLSTVFEYVNISELLILLYNVLFYHRLLSSLFLNCENRLGSCGVRLSPSLVKVPYRPLIKEVPCYIRIP